MTNDWKCIPSLTYTIDPPGIADKSVAFDTATNTFTFFNDFDLGPASMIQESYTITITATTSNGLSGTVDFILTLKNPCIDPNYVEIVPS